MGRRWLFVVLTLAIGGGLAPSPARGAGVTPPVGTVRQWLGSDDFNGTLYRKNYTLRGVGSHIEVWVAVDRAFPAGDCRNQVPGSTDVTDAQVADLVSQFDGTIYSTETGDFSTPPDRDGSNSLIGADGNGNGGDYTGAGNRTVVLVDNIRDDNYYTFPAAPTFTEGSFSTQFNELFDRNVVYLDVFDWAHRTGANPPDDPAADLCLSRRAAPRAVEGELAADWQRLLHYYTDPNETEWLNDGLSGLARLRTGYGATAARDLACFTGFGTSCGGPSNALTLFNETGSQTRPADRGNVTSLMAYLRDRYGAAFTRTLHNDGQRQGLASIQAALGATSLGSVLYDFQTMVLVDSIVDRADGKMGGIDKARVTSATLDSTLNLENLGADAVDGAPPNGADYVRLEDADGKPLNGGRLAGVDFEGAATLPTQPLAWSIVNNDPDRPGNPVLFSGNTSNRDESAVVPVTVPAQNATLTFLAKYGAEFGYDFGYVQVSTDGGATYTSIPGDRTVPGPRGPALNGTTSGFEPHSFDLSAYAGQSILVAFRYVSDGGVNEGGLLIDDVKVGTTTLSDGSSLAPFKSRTEIRPTSVTNWDLRLVGLDAAGHRAQQLDFDGQRTRTLTRSDVAPLVGYPTVVAIVAYDQADEGERQFAPYTLTATEGDEVFPPPEVTVTPSPEPTVTATATTTATPTPTVTPPPGRVCRTADVSLAGVRPFGSRRNRRARVIGAAPPSRAGAKVTVLRDDQPVGSTAVRGDGTIRASVPARKGASYRLVLGTTRSNVLYATARARTSAAVRLADGRLQVKGRVLNTKRRRTLDISGELVCEGGAAGSPRSVRTTKDGRFTLVFDPPAAGGSNTAIYRVTVRGASTVTFPIALTRR